MVGELGLFCEELIYDIIVVRALGEDCLIIAHYVKFFLLGIATMRFLKYLFIIMSRCVVLLLIPRYVYSAEEEIGWTHWYDEPVCLSVLKDHFLK